MLVFLRREVAITRIARSRSQIALILVRSAARQPGAVGEDSWSSFGVIRQERLRCCKLSTSETGETLARLIRAVAGKGACPRGFPSSCTLRALVSRARHPFLDAIQRARASRSTTRLRVLKAPADGVEQRAFDAPRATLPPRVRDGSFVSLGFRAPGIDGNVGRTAQKSAARPYLLRCDARAPTCKFAGSRRSARLRALSTTVASSRSLRTRRRQEPLPSAP